MVLTSQQSALKGTVHGDESFSAQINRVALYVLNLISGCIFFTGVSLFVPLHTSNING